MCFRIPILLLFLATTTIAQEPAPKKAEQPAPANRKYDRLPWHLVDIWWNLGEDRPFESYEIDVAIVGEIRPEVNLYIAPLGLAHLGKTPVYGGIQTNADGYTKAERRLRKIGPGFLMSMWNERSVEAIRPADGGLHQSSGHEGDFVSVRRPFRWQPGRYTWRMVQMDRQNIGDKSYTWVGAFVFSHATDENIFVGSLRFPGEKLILDHSIASFVEIYGGNARLEDIPQVEITFSKPRVNHERPEKLAARAIYPADVPDYAEAVADGDDSLKIRVGHPIENRKDRDVPLLPKVDAK